MKRTVFARTGALLLAVFVGLIAFIPQCGLADAEEGRDEYIILGADITQAQRDDMMALFNPEEGTPVVTVTNAEEHEALDEYMPRELIGTRALSCAYMKLADSGHGITVSTSNITYVTADMYANALATAGVTDADLTVSAPIPVSGTAALTGILNAYEKGTRQALSSLARSTATEELVRTGELGEVIGTDEAAQLIALIKQRIIELGLDDEDTIRDTVKKSAKELKIELTDTQVEALVQLMLNISKLNLDPQVVANQINTIYNEIQKFMENDGDQSFFQKLMDAVNGFFDWIKNLFR